MKGKTPSRKACFCVRQDCIGFNEWPENSLSSESHVELSEESIGISASEHPAWIFARPEWQESG